MDFDLKRWKVLSLAIVMLFSIGFISQNVFAMGQPPSACENSYNSPIITMKINNGTQTFDPLANPGLTFNVDSDKTYQTMYVLHIPSQSSKGNVATGTTWVRYQNWNFGEGECYRPAYPNGNVVLGWYTFDRSSNNLAGFSTTVNGANWNVNWVSPHNTTGVSTTAPEAPTNLSAWAISSSQIELGWNAPNDSSIIGYKIERSQDGGATWATIATNTSLNTTIYSDSGLAANTSYYYRVSAINPIGTSSSSIPTFATTFYPTLTVNTQDTNGNAITGFNATLSQNGNEVATGLTPVPFTLTNNLSFNVNISNNSNYIFDHWQDTGSADANRDVSISSDTTITAVFKKVSSNIIVNSLDTNGDQITGIHTEVYAENGTQINSGYTPATFVLGIGQKYTIHIDNYNQYTFDHWQDTGSTNSTRDITVTSDDSTISAIFQVVTYYVPSAPQNLVASSSNGQINLSWSAPSSSGSFPITNYDVYRSTTSGGEVFLARTGNVTSYDDAAVSNGTTYYYKVLAISSVGESNPSNEASATVSSPTQTAFPLVINSEDNNGFSITGLGTKLFASNGTEVNSGVTPSSFDLVNGASYTVSVENNERYVFDHWLDTGSTDASRAISITSGTTITAIYKTVPHAPVNLSASAGILRINLSWTAPYNDGGSPVTGYMIEKSTDNGFTWTTIVSNTDSTQTSYSDANVKPLTTYTYRVSAINSVGASDPSNNASASTPSVGAIIPRL